MPVNLHRARTTALSWFDYQTTNSGELRIIWLDGSRNEKRTVGPVALLLQRSTASASSAHSEAEVMIQELESVGHSLPVSNAFQASLRAAAKSGSSNRYPLNSPPNGIL